MRTGVDVSKYQHPVSEGYPSGAPIDYATAVAAGVDFAIVEALDEDGVANPFYQADLKGFAAAGAGVGSYVFLRPELGVDAAAAALLGVAAVRVGEQAHTPAWGDLEVAMGLTAVEVKLFWHGVRDRLPTVGIATNPGFLGWSGISAADRPPLWLDEWGVANPTVAGTVVWGMTDKANVPGIPAPVDLDAFMASDTEWADLFGEISAPPAPAARFVSGDSTPSGRGYWLASDDGRIAPFGDAAYHGSPSALNAAVVELRATPTGRGYRLFCADGGVFDYGDARFAGSGV